MRFQTSIILIIVCLLFSNSIVAQKKWPGPKTDSYSIYGLNPSGDGYILSNLNFSSKVNLEQPQRDKYTWYVKVLFTSCNIDGYVYNGVSYSKNELMNDFGISNHTLTSGVTLKSVVITFNNGKKINSRYLEKGRSIGTQQSLSYSANDENSDFNLRSISIDGTTRNLSIDSKIKSELARQKLKRKNEEFKKREEERIKKLKEEEERLAEIKRQEEIAKKEEAERLAEIKMEEEIAKKEEEERLAEIKRQEEDDYEKELEEAIEQAEKEAAIKKKNAKEEREMIKEFNEKMSDERVKRAAYSRNRLSPEQMQMQAINQFRNDLRQVSNQFLAFMAQNSERKEQERLKKLEEKRIENERIAEEKRIEEEQRIAEEKRLNELKNKPEYVNFLDKALNDVFYFDSSGKKVDQKNATFEQVYIKQENGFYVAKYFNLKEGYLAYDISYEIIPNPFIESLKTGSSIKYGVLNTKEEINYYYRNKLKQKTLNFWWVKKMHFEFYNYKDEKVFGSGAILKPETMPVSSSGAITRMEYKITKKQGKVKNYRLKFDYKGNVESLYVTNEKGKIEERYKFSKY